MEEVKKLIVEILNSGKYTMVSCLATNYIGATNYTFLSFSCDTKLASSVSL
jgi:hypothetical protein